MTAITVRKLPDDAKQRLRMRAAANGRSMEAEARTILLAALDEAPAIDIAWVEALADLGEALRVKEVPLPADEPAPAADLR